MVINDELEIRGLKFYSETFALFNPECINHTNHLFTRTIAISDIALLNVINKELNIIITLGMNKEHKLKNKLINTNRII